MTPNPTVREIAANWLKEHGYDGLFNPGVCCCERNDIAPSDYGPMRDCLAGHFVPCPGPEECEYSGTEHYHIGVKSGLPNADE